MKTYLLKNFVFHEKIVSPRMLPRSEDNRFIKGTPSKSVTFKKEDAVSFCLDEMNEEIKQCMTQYPVYDWTNRKNGGFWKRTWEMIVWGFDKNKSGNLIRCYRNAIKNLKNCVGTDVSAKIKISDYIDDWLIPHKMGNCSGIVVPKTRGEKILGCDGITTNNITNPRYNQSKGKVMNCDTDLPDTEWCACPGYPIPNSEAKFNPALNKCVCNNPAEVPHFHYRHELRGVDGLPITCCGPPCDYGYEYDCIERTCKPSLYNFEK